MKLVANVGTIDRAIRAIAGLILLVLGLAGVISGAGAVIAIIVGVVLLATSVISFCPLYTLIRFSTKRSS